MNRIFTTALFLFCAIGAMAQPAGYYNNAAGKTCADLKTALRQIIDDQAGSFSGDVNTYKVRTYDDLQSQYPLTDVKPREIGTGSATVIWDVYSDIPGANNDPYNFTPNTNKCGNYSGEGQCYNREHSFPQSWFKKAPPMVSDYIHVLPTDGSVNGKRDSYKYGKVDVATYTSKNGSKLGSSAIAGITGPVFEPIDEYKGDLARIYLYMVTRYEDLLPTWKTYGTEGSETLDGTIFPAVERNYLNLMLQWHAQDPVSQKEIDRNNGAYSFQKNRNPYVDHPEYVGMVWNPLTCKALPVEFYALNGQLNNGKVSLTWNVANEVNLQNYAIERSVNGNSYQQMGLVPAQGISTYSYTDDASQLENQQVYYRIVQIDANGQRKTSKVFAIKIQGNTLFSIYPNPAKASLNLSFAHAAAGSKVTITDLAGRIQLTQIIPQAASNLKLNIQNLSSGSYFVKIGTANGQSQSKLLIVK